MRRHAADDETPAGLDDGDARPIVDTATQKRLRSATLSPSQHWTVGPMLRCVAATAAGVALLAASLIGLSVWITAAWYNDPELWRHGWEGFDRRTFAGLAVFTLCTTLGYALAWVGITAGVRLSAPERPGSIRAVEACWLGLQVLLGLGSIAMGIGGAVVWGGGSFMDCLGVLCFTTPVFERVKLPHTVRDSKGIGWLGSIALALACSAGPLGVVAIYRALLAVLRKPFGPGTADSPGGAGSPVSIADPADGVAAARANRRSQRMACGKFAGALIALVFFFWIALYLPNDWEYFTDKRIAHFARLQVVDPSITDPVTMFRICNSTDRLVTCPELPWAFFRTHQLRLSDTLYLKFFPGNVFFFAYLVGVLAAAFIVTHANRRWAAFWGKSVAALQHKRLPQRLHCHISRGELAAMAATVLMLAASLLYWAHDHNFNEHWDPHRVGDTIGSTSYERWSRAFGQIAVVALSLLLFAGSRESVMHQLLGTTWERLLWAHKAFGYLMVVCVALHAALWYKQYADWGIFPSAVVSVRPALPYDENNFTIPLISITSLIGFIAFDLLSLEPVRRRFFELFYYAHLFAAWTTIPATLWHAAAGWEFMLPGLTVWMIDRLLRASRSAARVRVLDAKAIAGMLPDGETEASNTGRYVELKIAVDAAAVHASRPGQYVFVNVAEASLFEWHPLTISRCPMAGDEAADEFATATDGGDYLTLHIKSAGPGTWTDRVFNLVATGGRSLLTVAIDGPCGRPFDWRPYTDVVLIGGGIGVTPVACIFDSLKRTRTAPAAIDDAGDAELDDGSAMTRRGSQPMLPRKLRAFWALRDEHLLDSDLRRQLASVDGASAMDDSGNAGGAAIGPLAFPDQSSEVFLTQSSSVLYVNGGADDEEERDVAIGAAFRRPNLPALLCRELCEAPHATAPLRPGRVPLVFVCGPDAMVLDAQRWCAKRGVAFHRETFDL